MNKMSIRKITETERQKIAHELKTARDGNDQIFSLYLGIEDPTNVTTDFTRALELLPKEVHFLLGRNEHGSQYWCDVGHKPQVQGWGVSPATAVAAAAFLYYTHPVVKDDERPEDTRPCETALH